ncbi:hypothetical protein N0V93_004232 [Gnomoniopsis smithogilvyi]|uniref:Xylanolytic transcriptional activator regulatory domain-containing protein n=1 Tax=Gnomoniopsis smithogilvyi TaxID=1191159 RepID=A0A9W9CWX6_9PEZI|nr:hypothetical protein N0V93_004232 [Gnomoniopsis smithogilvyi]
MSGTEDKKYPEATPLPPKRTEPPTATKQEREAGSDRKRLKKIEDVSRGEGSYSAAALAEDILSAHYLTPKLWSEVFDIYRLHFATELPFLHIPTLKEDMGAKFRATHKDTPPDTNLVLLGVLTLTARFHQDLVKYATHTASAQPGAAKSRPVQYKSDSSAASEFFAEALRKALGPLGTAMTTASVERVQAFLMLGLYEWSQVQPKTGGLGAWMYVGVAIRMAQALGLGFGDKPDRKSRARAQRSSAGSSRVSLPQPELMISKEIKRRTMFSCLILDRLLSCGKERVSTIRSEDLQIQLPCNEWAFDLSKEVKTGFLPGSSDEEGPRDVEDDSVLSRFVRLVELWGDISNFSFAGGRLVEEHPPWDPRNRFCQLRRKLEAFYSDLQPTFTLSTTNYHRHENHQASSVYVALHMLGSVCQIMLNREYIPFLPIRCDKPIGPLDEPTFPAGQYDVPEGFWEDSAERVFKAARDIVDLIEICRDKLPMSALVLFSIWIAAFVGQYAWHFPHMDQQRHMLVEDDEDDRGSEGDTDLTKTGPTGTCYQTLIRISGWLKMASTYAAYFKEIDSYITKIKQDYQKHLQASNDNARVPNDDGKPPIHGGGLEEWKRQNAKIINNGMIMAEDDPRHAHEGGSERSRASTVEPGSVPDGTHKTPRSNPSMFTAINRHTDGHVPESAHPSPMQAYQALPGDGDLASHPGQGDMNGNVVDHICVWESTRIADCLGGVGGDIQGFSYGDVPDANLLFGQAVPMLEFGGYS